MCTKGDVIVMLRIYDGSTQCAIGACPVADYDQEAEKVIVHDPGAPEKGTFNMSKGEWNALLANARPIE